MGLAAGPQMPGGEWEEPRMGFSRDRGPASDEEAGDGAGQAGSCDMCVVVG